MWRSHFNMEYTYMYLVDWQVVNGNVHYVHPRKTFVLDGILVNDGKWHYLEVRWQTDNTILITLDYGQIRVSSFNIQLQSSKLLIYFYNSVDGVGNILGWIILIYDMKMLQTSDEMGDWVNGLPVGEVTLGGLVSTVGGNILVTNGLEGCVQDVRVGNSANSVLMRPGESNNVKEGCEVEDACEKEVAFPCPDNSYCNNEWGAHTCTCESGRCHTFTYKQYL